MAPYWDSRRQLVDDRYRSIAIPFADAVREEPSMSFQSTLQHLNAYLGTWSCLKTFRERHPDSTDPREALMKQLAEDYGGDATAAITLSFDLTLLLGRQN